MKKEKVIKKIKVECPHCDGSGVFSTEITFYVNKK